MKELNKQIDEEHEKQREALKNQSSGGAEGGGSKTKWTTEEAQLLIKGVNLFPAGTVQRFVYLLTQLV